LVDIKASELHKIFARPTIVAYYDMVRWIISHTNISTCIVVNSPRQVVGSFRPEDVNNMYKLSPPIVRLDDNFIKEFIKKNVKEEEVQIPDLIKEWWYDPNSFKIMGDKMYLVPRLKKSPMLVAIMLCHLYGEKNSTKFKLSWVPLIHQVLTRKVFNWSHILSANIKQEVQKVSGSPSRIYCLGFFMSSYLVDVVCVVTPFPLLGWSWSPSKEAVHLCCSKM
jgi:hypothetical protein